MLLRLPFRVTSTALGPRLVRAALVVTLPIAALVAGCTSDPEEPTPSSTVAATTEAPTITPTPEPATTGGLAPADEAAILDAWNTYLTTYESAYSSMDPDPGPWKAFGTEELIALQVKQINAYKDGGITFEGTRSARDVTVEGKGPDVAVIRACLDESGWKGEMDGEPLPPRPRDVYPTAIEAIRVGGTWLLSPTAKQPEGETC
jgi:hypothetical protein